MFDSLAVIVADDLRAVAVADPGPKPCANLVGTNRIAHRYAISLTVQREPLSERRDLLEYTCQYR
jgi:hypothetical protein